MDYLSIQQRKEALDDAIYRAIRIFEKETRTPVVEVRINRVDDRCTGTFTKIMMKERSYES